MQPRLAVSHEPPPKPKEESGEFPAQPAGDPKPPAPTRLSDVSAPTDSQVHSLTLSFSPRAIPVPAPPQCALLRC